MTTRRFRALGDGWYAWLDGPGDVTVHVKFSPRGDGRLGTVALRLEGKVSAEALRSVPVGRIEAAANAELLTPGAKPRKATVARIPDEYRSNAVRGYPDAFYDVVASAYRTLSASTPKPVAELAYANEVPLTTAQRWVKEARRRGLLSPGHPGTAG